MDELVAVVVPVVIEQALPLRLMLVMLMSSVLVVEVPVLLVFPQQVDQAHSHHLAVLFLLAVVVAQLQHQLQE